MNKEDLKRWIKGHEGYDNKPYVCSGGKISIGNGRNLTDLGISPDEGALMFDNDMKRVEKELLAYPWYVNSPSHVKDALFNMCFNLGITRLLLFKKMIAAIIDKDYTKAALEALDSKWSKQLPHRSKDVALMMRQGK